MNRNKKMRKSTRDAKKTELFQFAVNSKNSGGVYEEDDNESPDTDEEKDLFHVKPAAAARGKKAPVVARKKTQDASVPGSLFGKCIVENILLFALYASFFP